MLEVLVSLCLSVVVLLGVAPLWITVVASHVEAHGLLTDVQRWRVVAARLETDLRGATADGTVGLGCSPVLEATPTRLALLTRGARGGTVEIVAWEFAAGALMRRRTPLPSESPPRLPISYSDNKTMLENIESGRFSYRTGIGDLGESVSAAELWLVDGVRAVCFLTAGAPHRRIPVAAEAGIGW